MHTIDQNVVSLPDLFTVSWPDARKAWCSQEKNSSQKISEIYSNLEFIGLAKDATSIIDRGYEISFFGDPLRIKYVCIHKPNSRIRTDEVYVKSLHFYDGLKLAIQLFKQTLGVNIPYYYGNFFEAEEGSWRDIKNCIPLVNPFTHHQTNLDQMLVIFHSMLTVKKVTGEKKLTAEKLVHEYSIVIESKHAINSNQKLFEIFFDKLVDK